MSRLDDRAAAIRQYLHRVPGPFIDDKGNRGPAPVFDRKLVHSYSVAAARLEELRLRQHDRKTDPYEDERCSDLGRAVDGLAARLGLGPGFDGFLPHDPGRLCGQSWLEHARMWFGG
jgi:hypothetical protein